MRNRSLFQEVDWFTVFVYIALTVIGLFSIYAASYDGNKLPLVGLETNFGKQFFWALISILVAIIILVLESNFYTTFAYVIYALVIAILIYVLLFGEEIKGSRSWIDLGPVNFQPSEIAKYATALALAKFLSTLNVDLRFQRDKLLSFLIISAPSILILAQGDYGSALIFSVFLFVLYREGIEPGYLILGFYFALISLLSLLIPKFIFIAILAGITAIVIYYVRQQTRQILAVLTILILTSGYIFSVDYVFNNFLEERHRERINVMLGKSGDDWNVRQSKIAIGSGGWNGKGFLNGTQTQMNFVPEQTTDFIFSTIGEEHGFLGTSVVIFLFLALIIRLMQLADRQRSRFSRIYGYSIASLIFFNFFVNVAMTIGLFPVIGIPLPMVSYGGSSLLAYTIMIFTMLKLDAQRLQVLR